MGRVFRPEYMVAVRTEGGEEKQQVRRTAWYHVEYTDAQGKTRRKKAAPTYELAKEVLRKLEEEAAAERYGLPTQKAVELLVADLKGRYLASQKPKVTPAYYASLEQRLDEILTQTRTVTIRDLTPEKVEAFLAGLKKKVRKEDGAFEEVDPAPATINLYLLAVRSMLNWAVTMRILPFNPLACIRPRSGLEKHRRRRDLTEAELARLFDAAKVGPIVRAALPFFGKEAPPEAQESDEKRWNWLQSVRDSLESGKTRLSPDTAKEAAYRGERNCMIYRLLTYTGLR